MKANEAPEKIILSADRETGTLYDEWVIKDLTDNIKIEYTRTDVFIEKACEYWYQYNRDIVKTHGTKAVLGCTVNVEGFRKYMEE